MRLGGTVGALDGKVAIVTGGAGGIGSATARRVAEEGAAVAVADIRAERAEEVAATLCADGLKAIGVGCDLGDEDDVARLVRTTVDELGAVDLLDHNAAWSHFAKDTDALGVDLEVWDRTIRVNTRGALLLARHVIPHMKARGAGAIVNISSGSGTIGTVNQVAYGASKAAVNSVTRHLTARYGRDGIRANAIAPGFVVTASAERGVPERFREELRQQNPSGRLGRPIDIANVVVFLLSDAAGYLNGQVIHVDGGLLAVGRIPPVEE